MSDFKVQRGIITGYNTQSSTAQIITYDGNILEDVACPVTRFDVSTGAVDMKPPSLEAPCLCCSVGGENFILTMFPPANVTEGESTDKSDIYNNHINRSNSSMNSKELLPGQSFNKNAMGGCEVLDDTCKKIIMSPNKLSTVWNTMNNTYDTVCTQYNIRSSGMDVRSEATDSDAANTTIKFKRSMGEDPGCVEVNVGDDADVIIIKIAGKDFLHVDQDRNVTLTIKNMDIVASDNINISANEVNFVNTGTVKLP